MKELKSLIEKEKTFKTRLVSGELSTAFKNELDLITYLFRSEDTVEWIVGSKELGRRAVSDDDYFDVFSNCFNWRNISGKKKREIVNIHAQRHSMLALISYCSELIASGTEDKRVLIVEGEELKPSQLLSELVTYFELESLRKIFEESNSQKELKKHFNRFQNVIETACEKQIAILAKKNTRLRERLDKQKENPKAVEAIRKEIYEIEDKINLTKNVENLISEGTLKKSDIILYKEFFYNYLRIDTSNNIINEYFSSFDHWAIGSLYYGIPDFIRALNEAELNEESVFKSFNIELVLDGILRYRGIDSSEYPKCSMYIAQALEQDYPEAVKSYIKNSDNDLLSLQKGTDAHFSDALVDIAAWRKEDLLKTLKKHDPVAYEKINPADPEQSLKDLLLELSVLMKNNVSDISSAELNSFYIACSLLIKKIDDYEFIDKLLNHTLDVALKHMKKTVFFLMSQIKINDYHKIQKLIYNTNRGALKSSTGKIDYELTHQFLTVKKVVKEWAIPEFSDKHVGTICARIIQIAQIVDDFSSSNNSLLRKYIFGLMYGIPVKKVFRELANYLAFENLEALMNAVEPLLNQGAGGKVNEDQLFDSYFTNLNILFPNVECKYIYDRMLESRNLEQDHKEVLSEILAYKLEHEIIAAEGMQLLDDARGRNYLTKCKEDFTIAALEELEEIIANRASSLYSLRERKLEDESVLEDDMHDELYWLLRLREWSNKHLPYLENRYMTRNIKKDEAGKREIFHAFKENDEAKILKFYSLREYSEFHALFERWLSKRILFKEILDINLRPDPPDSGFGASKMKKLMIPVYRIITSPVTAGLLLILPLFLYMTGLPDLGNIALSATVSLINLIIPLIILSMVATLAYRFLREIGLFFRKRKGQVNDNLTFRGVLISDFFLPRIFGLILLGLITLVITEESWLISFGFQAEYSWIYILMLILVYVFLKNSAAKSLGEIIDRETTVRVNNEVVDIKVSSLNRRVTRVLQIGLVEAYLVAVYACSYVTNIMVEATDSIKIAGKFGESVFGIPKLATLKVHYISFGANMFETTTIKFAPFFVFNSVILALFASIVLNSFLNKNEIL